MFLPFFFFFFLFRKFCGARARRGGGSRGRGDNSPGKHHLAQNQNRSVLVSQGPGGGGGGRGGGERGGEGGGDRNFDLFFPKKRTVLLFLTKGETTRNPKAGETAPCSVVGGVAVIAFIFSRSRKEKKNKPKERGGRKKVIFRRKKVQLLFKRRLPP